MVIELTPAKNPEHLKPRILIIGVGGAGCNAINNMIACDLQDVEFLSANTDSQSLSSSQAPRKLQLGAELTAGQGAGSDPQKGQLAAEESRDAIGDILSGCNLLFITAGMGGGTGTGATPVIAGLAQEMGILTVGMVTKPFDFEGKKRMQVAEQGICALQEQVNSLIIIPNQNLFRIANQNTTFLETFRLVDDVLYSGVRSITDLIGGTGFINLDFADVCNVMRKRGRAVMGSGEAEGEGRAVKAAEQAFANPLLEKISLHGAQELLVNVTAASGLTLPEVEAAVNRIRSEVGESANIHFGTVIDATLSKQVRVALVATGIEDNRDLATEKEMQTQSSHSPIPPVQQQEESQDYAHHHRTEKLPNPPDSPAPPQAEAENTAPISSSESSPNAIFTPALAKTYQPQYSPQHNLGGEADASNKTIKQNKTFMQKLGLFRNSNAPDDNKLSPYPLPEATKSPQNESPQKQSQNQSPLSDIDEDDDDSLRIPAFLRRNSKQESDV